VVYAPTEKDLDGVVSQIIRKGGKAEAISKDLTSFIEVEELMNEVIQNYGRIDRRGMGHHHQHES
jgi:NAD(P)-dependent dehydrogenase (short-subunit alcohol dehydrogenase family)